MRNLSDREEQEMIERAKGGDPQANYELSLWALDRAEEEPTEERWNRLAAKCMVKAAQGGYGPAMERMTQLLHQRDAAQAEPPAEKEPEPQDDFDWDGYQVQQPEYRPSEREAPGAAARAIAVLGAVGGKIAGLFRRRSGAEAPRGADGNEDEYKAADAAEDEDDTPRRRGSKGWGRFDPAAWSDQQWKRVKIIGIAVCVALVLLIVILVITGRKKQTEETNTPTVPTPNITETEPTPTPEPITYPDETTRSEIESASLDIFPEDSEYVTEATTATVSASGGLNLRKGPSSSYSQVVLMDNGSTVEVFAVKDGWMLVRYSGSTWGWCSEDYLTVTADTEDAEADTEDAEANTEGADTDTEETAAEET